MLDIAIDQDNNQLSVGIDGMFLEIHFSTLELFNADITQALLKTNQSLTLEHQSFKFDVNSLSVGLISLAEQGPQGPAGSGSGESYVILFDELTVVTGIRGESIPGTATDESAWRITFITVNSDLSVSYTYPDGDSGFNYVWDSRSGYSYA